MSAVIETEQELTGDALRILQQNLPPHKVARLLSIWHVGQGDDTQERQALFAGETVDSLFEQAMTYQTK
ncbi:MAG: hypothetical protein IAE77_29070 [Prosthecobacter sp.]|jgi:hypothetical protein|uniref:hypothetical protein n=1 Tax=Prosthecobacter sp. TaxID=1965333 RepID=UPI0019ED8CE0|nr:hypothetical protein [Prosthecobacter sp.]MBE2287543.1 hypothetical protein [Prosthecobacter sp.]